MPSGSTHAPPLFIGAMMQLPHALPSLFAGIKVAAALSATAAVVAEFVASDRGLGYLLMSYNGDLNTTMSFAAIFVLSAMGLLLYGAVELAECLFERGLVEQLAELGVVIEQPVADGGQLILLRHVGSGGDDDHRTGQHGRQVQIGSTQDSRTRCHPTGHVGRDRQHVRPRQHPVDHKERKCQLAKPQQDHLERHETSQDASHPCPP